MFARSLAGCADPALQRISSRRCVSRKWRHGLLFAAMATIIPPDLSFRRLDRALESAVAFFLVVQA
ncbi:hypothetical protein [Bradyrhizobium sp.]|uniref:hypothetical protein n=1 Tax=Bradyrhizobium sp. TaxID=376 RepID=UPI00272FF3D8|nr:hypothetical protein [Bradyrhizobium sp.]